MKNRVLKYTLWLILGIKNGVQGYEGVRSYNPNLDIGCVVENKAFSGNIFESFTRKPDTFSATTSPSGVEYTANGLQLSIKKRFDNPSITSNFYIMYGKAEVEIRASHGQGIISSFYLQSNDLDEIDVAELFGGNPYEVQSNYFIKGNTTTYDRGAYHPIEVPPMSAFVKYGIEWNPSKLVWTVNGRVVRELTKDNPQGFPSSPMTLTLSLWAGGDPGNAEGTISWAGGKTSYNELPYLMFVRSLQVTDYSTKSSYVYGNSLGKGVSIAAKDGHNASLGSPIETEIDSNKALYCRVNRDTDIVDNVSDVESNSDEYNYTYNRESESDDSSGSDGGSDIDTYDPKPFLGVPPPKTIIAQPCNKGKEKEDLDTCTLNALSKSSAPSVMTHRTNQSSSASNPQHYFSTTPASAHRGKSSAPSGSYVLPNRNNLMHNPPHTSTTSNKPDSNIVTEYPQINFLRNEQSNRKSSSCSASVCGTSDLFIQFNKKSSFNSTSGTLLATSTKIFVHVSFLLAVLMVLLI
ncbi:Piso0_000108 [Millerozyma farinosa CBS 7064]|uniref:Piso0_000108 protein n=1 Tax=Pichia sorbitophila (strain ATCC MYA-4447 / BCRC 22081 / CBS 7064 / NBRC 10061 / NRRL Y-12695) TaxID=559304 RepID=G8YT40_PICSO|nr:Piso0_000108 [Millerozyma farinosa CBS 7064]